MDSALKDRKISRVLVMAHGHPDFALGGGELAAYNLFKSLRDDDTIDQAWFVARHDSGNGPTGALTLRRENEYLWQQSLGNSFLLKAANSHAIWNDFRQLIRVMKPTVVNLHHYFHLGIELLRVIKEEDPDIRVVLTLHEYMAICHQQGQMVKRGSNKLCFSSSLEDCHRCFPEFTKEQFWLRRSFIGHHFDYVDHFISPSHFLKQRYVEWGIAEEKISVIENGQSPEPKLSPRPLPAVSEEKDDTGERYEKDDVRSGSSLECDTSKVRRKLRKPTRNRLAFFGQINPFKGIDVLMHAMLSMTREDRDKFVVEVHGANFEHQADDFKNSVMSMANTLMEEGSLRWVGPYEPFQVRERMRNVDWVIIPSIWWENSPMVIQEAFVNGRPVIASDIGGMKEKITHEVDGLHFEARNPLSLAETLKRAAAMTDADWTTLHEGIKAPLSYQKSAEKYAQIFEG
ncbi:glycosyltransferase family 4 protein [Vreelandella subglaciescola]|jgi:glycosyltransferase involved in cell wall biosynthesis|uniref:Glycosyltransferase involved in cell wall bisynthesis n=1 Tax=Vreelandella subglaciescola TaxID=29571 RepID=A0A1M7FIW0_9GAMM|nr:glycosyltransferase family 4 protein [Halomonas subglaciescola]SHM03946.1 Glycosyltransferase involved in cell wall bisynthesis [Halomonas subglaciescola]